MAVVTRSQNITRPMTATTTPRHVVMPKRKIREGEMNFLSSIKQHVASVAAGVPPGEGTMRAETEGHHRSLRKVFGSDAKAKYRRQPCPPISIQTKDISWPMGSGDRDSAQFEEYDVLSPSDIRSPHTRRSLDQQRSLSADANVRAPASAGYEHAGGTFPQSQRRAMSISRRPYTSSHPPRAGSVDSSTAIPMFTATEPMRHTASTSTSISSTSTTAPIGPNLSPVRPNTPASAFSYVDVRLPKYPHSPLSANTYFEDRGRVRRAGSPTSPRSLTPSRKIAGRSASPSRHCTDLLYQSFTSLDISRSTTCTVVSAALLSGNRPTSSRSGTSAASEIEAAAAAAKKPAEDDDALRGPAPRDDWDVVLDRIKEYRAIHEAPVDTVGCEALSEEEKDPKLRRFRSLVSLMLSAQTKDEITAEAVRTLSQRLPGGLTPRALSEAPLDMIHECVRRVGFWQRKANYIKEAARTCLEQYEGDIPRTVPQLLALPGVGPKMAYLAMHAAWQDTQGIGVDTHVLRITHRLGWVPEAAKSAEATRHSLESWMPKSLWREINPLLVGLGQTVCRGVGPKCAECPVNRYCPSAQARPRPGSSRRGTAYSRVTNDGVMSDSAEFGDVDVEDLASMVRGAEQAVRSRKQGRGRQPATSVKTEFPSMPDSPLTPTPSVTSRRMTRARAVSRLRPRQASTPIMSEDSDVGGGHKDTHSDSEPTRLTTKTSGYFARLRSNAASEEVRPEAKTEGVRSAQAKARAAKMYSRRLSRSDMQWALGEDWDPDDSSSLSSLSDVDISVADDVPSSKPTDDVASSKTSDNADS
ncbi:alpha,alpha-trehalase nth1 [Coemansia sp. RSA 1972]|nr:alpha,alpha-trehalase nth1 [Coemansia sp. RSA 1972]